MTYPFIVFCDFDGTITNWETAEELWRHTLGEQFEVKMKQLEAENSNTSRGIKELFGLVPSADYPAILNYANSIALRPGFPEFLDFLAQREIPFVVVSSGIRELLAPTLRPYIHQIEAYYCSDIQTDQEFLQISSPYDDGVDLLRKEMVMDRYSYDSAIYIGDSYSDMNGAQHADFIFARDRLASFLAKKERFFYPFNTFYDVIQVMAEQDFHNLSHE